MAHLAVEMARPERPEPAWHAHPLPGVAVTSRGVSRPRFRHHQLHTSEGPQLHHHAPPGRGTRPGPEAVGRAAAEAVGVDRRRAAGGWGSAARPTLAVATVE